MTEFTNPFEDTPAQKIASAVWRLGGDGSRLLDDAIPTGMLVIVEYESPQGDAMIRFHANGRHGHLLPSWRARGLLHELNEFVEKYCDHVDGRSLTEE